MRILRVEPKPGSPLRLDQEILVHFDQAVDPASVHAETLRLVDVELGLRVTLDRIRLRSSDRVVSLHPLIPVSSKLDDGSYRPGRRYRLEIATYPRVQSLRGRRGQLLTVAPRAAWEVIDPDVGDERAFLPLGKTGDMRLARPPLVDSGGRTIDLFFDRPVYPPSVPMAFGLRKSRLTSVNADALEIDSIVVTRRDAPGGPGSHVQLRVARALERGMYELLFRRGGLGVQSRDLRPLVLPPDPVALRDPDFGVLTLQVDRRSSEIVLEDFERPLDALPEDPQRVGIPGQVEGKLDWHEGGLFTPQLGFDDFKSIGSIELAASGDRQPPRTRVLRPGSRREISPGRIVELGAERWDLDRFVVPKDARAFLVVPVGRVLTLRVAGRFEVAGTLIVSGATGEWVRHTPSVGDPRPSWAAAKTRLEIHVGGVTTLSGEILAENAEEGVSGYLWSRGPFVGDWSRSRLQAWLRAPAFAAEPRAGALLPGRWVALSPWYPVALGRTLHGEVEGLPSGAEMLFQIRRGRETSDWTQAELLPGFGEVDALRFFVRVEQPRAGGLPILRSLAIR